MGSSAQTTVERRYQGHSFFCLFSIRFFFCVLITFERSRKHGQWSNDRALQLAVCEFYTAISGEFHVVVESVCVEWSLFWVFI